MVPSEPLNSRVASPTASFGQWLLTAPGQYVMSWERPHLDRAVHDVFGYHALQLGLPGINLLNDSRMPNRWLLSEQCGPAGQSAGHIVADFLELPFASQSVDLVLMPHILEMSPDPHQLLREVDRVLIPDGRLLIAGLNPLSLWGLRHLASRQRSPIWPTGVRPMGVPRLRDLLTLLSFEIESGRFGCYRWPSLLDHRLQRGAYMEKAGDRWWPMCGSAYILGAVKRTRKMTLIGPRWKQAGLSALPSAPSTQSSSASSHNVKPNP